MRSALRRGAAGLALLAIFGCSEPTLHTRLQSARLEAELSCGRSTLFASEPPALQDLEVVDLGALASALVAGPSHERWRAIEILGELRDPRAAPMLVRALADPGVVRPCLAAQALGQVRDPRAVDALLKAAQQRRNADLRLCAIKALGLLGEPRAASVLIERVQRRDMPVAAAFALARLGDREGARVVAEASADPGWRPWMVAPLGEFGVSEVRAALEEAARDSRPATRREATEGLWKLGVLQAGDRARALERVLDDSPVDERRAWAAFRLGDEGFDPSAEALVEALGDPSERVRLAAAAALMRLGSSAETKVLAGLKRGSPTDRYAIAVLGFIGGEQSRSGLEELRDGRNGRLATRSLRWLQVRGSI